MKPAKPRTLSQDKERILMQYAGVFPHNIKEYAEFAKKATYKKQKNHAR